MGEYAGQEWWDDALAEDGSEAIALTDEPEEGPQRFTAVRLRAGVPEVVGHLDISPVDMPGRSAFREDWLVIANRGGVRIYQKDDLKLVGEVRVDRRRRGVRD